MDVSCLKNRLTEEERRTFNETGLLMVENALSPERVKAHDGGCGSVVWGEGGGGS